MIRQKYFAVSSVIVCAALALGLTAAPKPGAGKADAAKGKSVVDDNCAVCHSVDTDEKKVGPSLKGLFKRKTLANGKPVNDANVLAQVNAGSSNGMPAYAEVLSADDKANLLAYLHTL